MRTKLFPLVGTMLVVVGVSAMMLAQPNESEVSYLEVTEVESASDGAVVIDANETDVLELDEVRRAVTPPHDNVAVSDPERLETIHSRLQAARRGRTRDESVSGFYIEYNGNTVRITTVRLL